MKHLYCIALVALLPLVAHDRAAGVVPDRKPLGDVQDPSTRFVNSIGMEFVWIPPGKFVMGSSKEENGGFGGEPVRKVTLTRGFYMCIHLVTQEQWQAVMGKNPSSFKGEKNLPVENVTWQECQDFASKLRAKDKKRYRLPTSAEWEYACRAGTTTAYYFGDKISTEKANFNGLGPFGKGKLGIDRKKTTPVGTFPPNPWGLYDMHGNLWQWCQDYDQGDTSQDATDPQGSSTPSAGRVFRGGCWSMDAFNCRSAARGAGLPDHGFVFVGCRLCFFPD